MSGCSPCCLILMATRAIGLGTSLPGIDTVIIHDSDWNQWGDLQALGRARCLGTIDLNSSGPSASEAAGSKDASARITTRPPVVLRLFARGAAEERALQLTDKRHAFEAAFKPGLGRCVDRASSLGGQAARNFCVFWCSGSNACQETQRKLCHLFEGWA